MNIYQRKSRLKLILIAIACLIALVTLWYTNRLAAKIANEEKKQVEIWAEAIKKRAGLVKVTNDLFARITKEQRRNVKTYAGATELVISIPPNYSEALTFLSEILSGNENIPVLMVNAAGELEDFRNVEFPGIEDSTHFRGDLKSFFSIYPPIQLMILDQRKRIYYNDSKIFSQLKTVLDDLVSSFISEVVVNSASVPVIMVDGNRNMIASGQVDTTDISNEEELNRYLESMSAQNDPIEVDLGSGIIGNIYYENSYLLKQLKLYPYVQLGIIGVFLFISYLAFSSSRKAEQNQVWVGLAKETAHQLGTPISSLSAWIEYIKETPLEERRNKGILKEVEKDVNRLSLVADRFSKIGSKPVLSKENVHDTVARAIDYMKSRSSEKVSYSMTNVPMDLEFDISPQLFDWVLENLFKNALDAMEGEGSIEVKCMSEGNLVAIEVKDTGKGILNKDFNLVFQPGYSTKKRGWGLGLSLTKRIVENYHLGKIFVKESEIEKGTTFRIEVPSKS